MTSGALVARVGADQQAEIGLLDAGDRGVEQIAAARAGIEPGAVLATVQMRRAEARHQVLEDDHRLAVDQIADDRRDPIPGHPGEDIADRGERVAPVGDAQLAVPPDHRHIQAPLLQAVVGEPRLVGDPLLVDVLVQARDDAHDLGGRASTRMLQPTASSTSIDSVLRSSHERARYS